MLFFLLINVKMPTIVGILIFMSRKNFILSRVEHEKSFITSGPDCIGMKYIEDIYFFEMNTKYISLDVLKISAIS